VDDAFAIAQLLKAPNIEVSGISAVFGNTLIDNSYPLCQEMTEKFADYKIPVYKGAAEALNLSKVQTNEAVEALAKVLKKQKLSILAIGPATNIGILLLKYPELKNQIEEVVLVAGRGKHTDHFEIGNKGRRAQDLNFDLDNNAFRIMFEHHLNIVLCPFEVSSKVWVKKEDLESLEKGDKCNQWLAEVSQNWLAQWNYLGAEGFNPFDVLASHYLIDADSIVAEKRNAHLEIHQDDTVGENDKTIFKQYLICDGSPGFPVTYCHNVADDFHEKLMKSFL
jgi:pyrimidine-specific ribonucleoside hydrolase